MKKIISAICAVTLIAATAISGAACTLGGRTSDNSIGELTSKEGKITIWWPGSTVEMKAIEQAKADYIEENPKVEIEIIGQSTADFYSAYMLACAGNSAPDIAYVDHVYVQMLAYYGYIANLSSAGFESLSDTFIPTLWDANFYEDSLYALPMSANILATVYNKTLIAKAQNTTTDKIVLPKNYDEFIELAKKINALNDASTAGDPYYAVTLPAGTGNTSMASMTYLAYVNRSGGTGILSEDLKESLINTQPCMDAALKLYELGQYSTPTFAEAKFESGRVGFIEMGPWKMSDYEKYSKAYNWEVGYTTAIPFTDGGNSGATLGLYSLVVTNNSNSALAADFVKFVASNDKYQLAFSTPQNLLPTTKTAIEDDYYSGDVWQVYVEQLENVVVRPGSPAWTDIESVLGTFVTNLVQRTYDGEDGVRQACIGIHNQVTSALEDIYSE